MAIRVIDDSKLQSIAVAIQGKDGGGQMTVDEMPTRIANIPSGGTLISKTITENGVYNASIDNADGYDVVTVDVPQAPNENFDKFINNTLVNYSTTATNIPAYCFYGKTSMVSILMPNVITIAEYGFEGCINLALTTLPSGITTIEKHVFTACPNITLTTLPSGITTINDYSFWGCTKLALTSLPSGVTSIGSNAFNGCENLALTSLPSGLTNIGQRVFEKCKKMTLTSLPSGLTNISQYSFRGCTGIPFLDFSDFTQIPTLGVGAFSDTTFPFYFRDQQQLDEWAAATNWSTWANRFQIKPSGVI